MYYNDVIKGAMASQTTRLTIVPWCMPRSLISVLLRSWWQGKLSRHSRRMQPTILRICQEAHDIQHEKKMTATQQQNSLLNRGPHFARSHYANHNHLSLAISIIRPSLRFIVYYRRGLSPNSPCQTITCWIVLKWYGYKINHYIPQYLEGCHYLFMPVVPASGTQVLIFAFDIISPHSNITGSL